MAKLNEQTIKEQELIKKQEESGNEVLCLMKIGYFFHAYNAGAYALARVMKYRVRKKVRRSGLEMITAGFPIDNLSSVLELITAAGGQILSQTDDWVEFTGIDCTSEGIVVMEPEKKVKLEPQDANVIEAIRSFDLLHSTPLDAVNFVGYLQTLVHK
jgi:DNA mismatch repair ATPase MutS